MNLAQFRSRFPEFRTAQDAPVQAALDAAALETNATELGSVYDEAHGLLAAHKLAISPFGTNARMVDESGTTSYERERRAVMARTVVSVVVT